MTTNIWRYMLRIFVLLFIFLFAVIGISASENSTTVKLPETLRIGWYPQYPFTYKKDIYGVSSLTGLDIELSRAIAKTSDIDLQFIEVPWDTQLKMLKGGKIDLMLSGLESSERFKDFRISNPIRTESTVLYVRKDMLKKIKFKKTKTFLSWIKRHNFKIGITKGNIYTDNIINRFITNSENSEFIKAAHSDLSNLRNLKSGKVIAVLVDKIAGASIVFKNNWQHALGSCYHPKFETRNVCYMLSKKSTTSENLKKINNAIALLKNDGGYKKIVQSYLFPIILNLTVNTWWYFYIVLAGTISYCICALRMVMEENQSLIGTLIFVSIYTIGGGTLRGILTGSYPLFFMHQPIYIYTILIITLAVFAISNIYGHIFSIDRKNRFLNIFQSVCRYAKHLFLTYIFDIVDAIGLAAFVVFGVIAALEVKAEPLILWGPILAMITTSGGGVLCNMLRSHQFDQTMKNMFTEISGVWGLVLSILLHQIAAELNIAEKILVAVPVTVIGAFFTRWLVCYYKIPSIHFLFSRGFKAKELRKNLKDE